MNGGYLLVAYHGCDATVRDDLVMGVLSGLRPSSNKYDWLGPGVYFYEGDCKRARLFAHASHDHPGKAYTAKPIGTPAVVGAVLRVASCIDMTTQEGLQHFVNGFKTLESGLAGAALPVNEAADAEDADVILHHLDAAVFNVVHQMRVAQALPPFQLVRGAFYQGKEAAPSSAFRQGSHVQLALRDPSCVLGWFLPEGDRLMSAEERALADQRLADARALRRAAKPRRKIKAAAQATK